MGNDRSPIRAPRNIQIGRPVETSREPGADGLVRRNGMDHHTFGLDRDRLTRGEAGPVGNGDVAAHACPNRQRS